MHFFIMTASATAGSGFTVSSILVIVIGAILLFSGISNFSEFFHLRKPGTVFDGTVDSSSLVERKDRKGNLVQYYWDLTVRYKNGNRIYPAKIKSSAQYEKGDKIKITLRNGIPVVPDDRHSSAAVGILLACAGAAIAAASVIGRQVSETAASYLVSVVLFLIAGALYASYTAESVTGMIPVTGTISKLILFQSDREARQVVSPKHWYPLISYEWDGKTREFLSRISSNYKSSFKVGTEVPLFFNPESGKIVERTSSKALPIIAVCLVVLSAVSAVLTAAGA